MQASIATDMPRERLIALGGERVSTIELLAVVLGAGTRGCGVLTVAERVLDSMGGVVQLARASPQELMTTPGIGMARATRIAAGFQLGRRALEASHSLSDTVCSAADIHARLAPRVNGLMQEVFIVLALDARNRIFADIEVARGCLTHVDVHPREVFRPLIRRAAAAAVVVHNHPSGDPEPSVEDISLTHRLRAVGEIIGIPVIDHLVITGERYVSIAGYLER